MCRRTTVRVVTMAVLQACLIPFPWCVWGRVSRLTGGVGWRHIGNSAIELPLPSLATGAVDRVWYSTEGSALFAKTASGRIFETRDFEQWQLITDPKITPPPELEPAAAATPEAGAKLASAGTAGRLYAGGRDVYRSDDGGGAWINLTAYKGACLLGAGLASVAASPSDPDEVTVASATGVWRSVDGGLSWNGLNDFLPNLPAGHLLALPGGTRGVRLSVADGAAVIEGG